MTSTDYVLETDPGPATDEMKKRMHVPTSADVQHAIRQLSSIRTMFEDGRPCRRHLDQTIEILYGLHARLVCLARNGSRKTTRKRRRS